MPTVVWTDAILPVTENVKSHLGEEDQGEGGTLTEQMNCTHRKNETWLYGANKGIRHPRGLGCLSRAGNSLTPLPQNCLKRNPSILHQRGIRKIHSGEGKNRAENAPNRKPRISLEKLRIYADKTVTEKDIKRPFHYEGANQEIIGL